MSKMKLAKVAGKNDKHKVLLYAISTCPWCKKAKRFLANNEVEYYYFDVDLASKEDHDEIVKDIHIVEGEMSIPRLSWTTLFF
jgi:glutaredoxin-like protein NrdH